MRQVLGRDGGAGVAHGELYLARGAAQLGVHASALVGVLAGVVQERARELAQKGRVAADGHARLQLGAQLHLALERHGLELQQLAFHKVGQVEALHGRLLRAFVRLGEQQQVAHQALHLLGFVLGALHPLALAGHAALGTLEEDRRVRQDHRERRLQVMGRVGHESALLNPCALHRPQRPAREEHAYHEERCERRHANARKREGERLPAVRRAHVGERKIDRPGCGALFVEQPEAVQAAESFRRVG